MLLQWMDGDNSGYSTQSLVVGTAPKYGRGDSWRNECFFLNAVFRQDCLECFVCVLTEVHCTTEHSIILLAECALCVCVVCFVLCVCALCFVLCTLRLCFVFVCVCVCVRRTHSDDERTTTATRPARPVLNQQDRVAIHM